MKIYIFIFFALIGAAAQGQTAGAQKLPKLRLENGIFTQKWEIGDQEKKEREVVAYLDKTHPESGRYMHQAQRLGKAALWATIIGGVGLIGGTLLEQNDNLDGAVAGGAVAIAGFGTAAGLLIGQIGKTNKAISTYNRFAGY